MSFYSRLGCLTLFIIKDFCTSIIFFKWHSIKSIIYWRSLEFSRDNRKAKKKSAFSLLLEILECFFSSVTKDWKQIFFFSGCFCCLQNFGSLSKHCLSTNILIKIWSHTAVSSARCFTGKEGETARRASFLFSNTRLTDGQGLRTSVRVRARRWGCSLKVSCLTW